MIADGPHLAEPAAAAGSVLPAVDLFDRHPGAAQGVGEVVEHAAAARARPGRRVAGVERVVEIAVGQTVDGHTRGIGVRRVNAHSPIEPPTSGSVNGFSRVRR